MQLSVDTATSNTIKARQLNNIVSEILQQIEWINAEDVRIAIAASLLLARLSVVGFLFLYNCLETFQFRNCFLLFSSYFLRWFSLSLFLSFFYIQFYLNNLKNTIKKVLALSFFTTIMNFVVFFSLTSLLLILVTRIQFMCAYKQKIFEYKIFNILDYACFLVCVCVCFPSLV